MIGVMQIADGESIALNLAEHAFEACGGGGLIVGPELLEPVAANATLQECDQTTTGVAFGG